MVKCVVIADDLTGANATGVMLKKLDYNTSTVINLKKIDLHTMQDCECVTLTTDSRGVDANQAYNRVYNTTKMCMDEEVVIYSKRIDSTLRGNLGSETDAMLDALGEDYTAIVVPCAPASGRITVGGYMLVNGVMLSRTEAALDPKTPITDSRVEMLFRRQTKYSVGNLKMEDLAEGEAALSLKMKEMADRGIRIIVCDSIVQEDIDLISQAVIQAGFPFIAVDPGAFTASLARKRIIPLGKKADMKILAVVGSVNPVAKTQMEYFWLSQTVYNLFIQTGEFLKGEEEKEREIDRVTKDILAHSESYELLSITGDGINPDKRLDFNAFSQTTGLSVDEISDLINEAIAEITYRILRENDAIGGIYTSGGDITAAVCRRFHTMGISLKDEVIPLSACGTFIAGEFPDRWIVTKGGMTGAQDAINACIAKLKAMLNI